VHGHGQAVLAAIGKVTDRSLVATMISFSAICVSAMLDMRRGAEKLARRSLENLAWGIEPDVNRNIKLLRPVVAECRQQSGAPHGQGRCVLAIMPTLVA